MTQNYLAITVTSVSSEIVISAPLFGRYSRESWAATLNAASITTTSGYGQIVSSCKLTMGILRLDNFHVYEVPSLPFSRLMSADVDTQAMTPSKHDLLLELHEGY
ncbi:hypothetical protein F442_20386 [Phytophthora nicotianae P10297]|uniref:Uncharacterized protein n=2 Tax=Phytophthora nicotianae TaxID=4792 RepID=V9E2X7_PHYNI|nr:hypothetical protein F443_20574 [Phytophthora nicotianae P1569]ETP30668.1 hypothetical protein F442_20386 [Phytophthora nicotianae P10297]